MRIGIIYVIISTLAFASMNVFVKGLSDLHPMQVVFFRGSFALLFLLPYMSRHRISIWGNQKKLLVLRGLTGTISIATFFFALQRIPLGSSTSIRYLGPVFAALFAMYFLKERVNKWQWLSFTIAFSGVILMKGFDVRIDVLSFSLVMISAVFLGVTIMMVRFLNAREHFTTIILYFMATSTLISLFFISSWVMPDNNQWWSLISVGILGLLGQLSFTAALRTEEASLIAPFRYLELVWALAFGYFLFAETYGFIALLGISMVIAGMIMNVYVKDQ